MLKKNENRLLFLIKIVPIIIIILFSLLTTIFSIIQNKSIYENEIEKLTLEYTNSAKERIKEEVFRVYNDVVKEKKTTEDTLKRDIKQRVEEAHAIATKIYSENKHKPQDQIVKMIKDALSDIRFNGKRGYYFAYKMDGTNILLPESKHLEGKNFINLQDAKGKYTVLDMIKIVKEYGSGFQTWWWYKPQDKKTQHKKIGYGKYFEPFDWFIGTGEYLDEFEKGLQKEVLHRISNIRYGKNGYVFVIDKNGTYLAHISKEYINKNRLDLQDSNGVYITKEILNIAKQGQGYLKYIGTIMPTTGKPAEKITFVKSFPKWGWAICTGTYLSELDKLIEDKKNELKEQNRFEIDKMIIFSVIITLIFLVLSFIFSRIIQKKFQRYRDQVREQISKNRQKDEIMFQQSKMASMGEMLENIAHQWRQPLSAISMTASGLQLRMELEDVKKDIIFSKLDNIIDSTMYLSHTIEDFRSFFKSDKTKKLFNLRDTIEQTIKIVDSKLSNRDIEIITSLDDIELVGLNNELVQVLMNIINNSRDILEQKDIDKKLIYISINQELNNAIIKIHDNGGGIPSDIINKIFEPYFTTKHQTSGTGIGLYMSREIIVKHMDGDIVATNKEFKYEDKSYLGAQITITIPCK